MKYSAENNNQIVEKIIDFQKKYNVYDVKYNNINIWPIVVYVILSNTPTFKNTTKPFFVNIVYEIFSYLKILYKKILDRKKISNNTNCDILFLTQPARRVKIGKKYFDRITDPFIDALKNTNYKTETLEWTYEHDYKTPRFNQSEFIQNSMDIYLFFRLFKKDKYSYKFDILKNDEFQEILTLLKIDRKAFFAKLKFSCKIINILTEYFDKKIKQRQKLKYAFFYPHNGLVSFSFNLACKNNLVKTVEIQHGYISGFNISYNSYYKIDEYKILPDSFWCWEESVKRIIENWYEKKGYAPFVYKGGNLYNRFWKYPKLNNNVFLTELNNKKNLKNDKDGVNILLTLSPIDNIPLFLFDFARKNDKHIRWYIRFHHHTPSKLINSFKEKFKEIKNIEYESANELPLPMLLKLADLHITIFSSCVADAKEFNKKSIVISEAGIDFFKDFIASDWVYPALNEKELEVGIDKIIEERKSKPTEEKKSNTEILLDFLNEFERFNKKKQTMLK